MRPRGTKNCPAQTMAGGCRPSAFSIAAGHSDGALTSVVYRSMESLPYRAISQDHAVLSVQIQTRLGMITAESAPQNSRGLTASILADAIRPPAGVRR